MSEHVAEKLHATLGASTASRWMACPGSVALSETVPSSHAGSNIHAQHGTAAHALAELALRKGNDASTYVGTTLEGIEVTDEMADFVQVFVDYCKDREMDRPGNEHWVERQFSLAHLNPPGPMFGTADFVAYDAVSRELEVVDFKYGQGVVVDVVGNKQLRYYALGAALSLPGVPITDVKMTIVQPRAMHKDGVIRSETIPFLGLLDFTNELLDAARTTTLPDAPLNPGSHCRWCRASGICPAQRDRAQVVAQVEFQAAVYIPPPPALVPTETLAEWAQKFSILEDWMAAVRAALQAKLERGEEVAGWKLVAKRANRTWVDETHTANWLEARGQSVNDIYSMKLRSPAQIEKLVGKKALPAEMTQKVSSGVSMVPASDARDAVTVLLGEEFGVLTAGSEENA